MEEAVEEDSWWSGGSYWQRDYDDWEDEGWEEEDGHPSQSSTAPSSSSSDLLQQQLREKVKREKEEFEKKQQEKQNDTEESSSWDNKQWSDEEWKEWKSRKQKNWQEDDEDWGNGNKRGKKEKGKGKGKGKGKDKGKEKGKGKGRWVWKEPEKENEYGDGKRKIKKKRKNDEWDDDDAPEMFGDTWEQPRQELGLSLLGELAPEGTNWDYVLMDESRRSFAGYLRSPFSKDQCNIYYEKVKEGTDWKQFESKAGHLVPRKTAWMTKKGCTCTYRYGGLEVPSQEFPPFMKELLRMSMHYCGIHNEEDWPDSCNLNLYEDGGMSVGWHADDEVLFQGKFNDIRIVSLSFGQARKFELRSNWTQPGEKELTKVVLRSGDLMTMEGMTQKHFQHRVPKEHCEGPRINLTWRWVLKHYPKCPAGRKRR